ncbi:MAG: hypothetical protein DIU78_006575 [Pseudomonadota bacterium]|nr:MAG: hypothetical protein DIU78_15290 [Pseudomonadota bacterium]
MRASAVLPLAALFALSVSRGGNAQSAAGSAAPAASAAPPASAAPTAPDDKGKGASSTCVERLPQGKARPKVTERIAPRATSGHALELELTIEHGIGETVLPSGFRIDPGSDDLKRLESASFYLPDPKGPARPVLERKEAGATATTTVKLSFVPLPKKPGRNELVLPPLPIAISRASGELMTLCTAPHPVTVEDPIANEPNPKPKQNPDPLRQREEWTAAKNAAIVASVALVLGALLAWLIGRWLKRPRPAPPPPPPRPPWEVAHEALFDLRHSGLLREQRFGEFYDRVSDVLRHYLGQRYGYDGLESTTREALGALRTAGVAMEVWVEIQAFMQEADLVKFARRTPTEAECVFALERAEAIVSRTRPIEAELRAGPPLAPKEPAT